MSDIFDKLYFPNVTKIAMFTDIHFGCKNNLAQHNEDCLLFLDWFIDNLKKNNCDSIAFLGDWFENRNAVNILTFKYSTIALRKLNQLGLPIFFIIGNHDLYHRHSRDVHSCEVFKEFENIHIIENYTIINDDLLFLPFLFQSEYPLIAPQVNKSKYVFGHLEFRNFYITGSNQVAEHGFFHKIFDGPIHIFSGHYHKRQASDNVIYIGNPFGTSFADAGDFDRGCAILDVETSEVDFLNYDGPTYIKSNLSLLVSDEVEIKKGARIKCLLDLDVTYSEAQAIKSDFISLYELREFILEDDTKQKQQALEESALHELEELDLDSLDETVKKLINTGINSTTTIFPEKLIKIYEEL